MASKQNLPEDDKVKCSLCKKEMNADDFAEHAINMHEDEVLDLLSDDDIIKGLSDWIE
jgi:hypothetical protein